MTTVPWPRMVKTRSTGRRTRSERRRGARVPAMRSNSARSSSRPAPVWADTGMTGAPSRKVPSRKPPTSSATISSQSGSTMSALVSATRPCLTPSRVQISRCSRVWGMTPSSAAMTSSTKSTPCAPATMFLTNRSWPGTSITPSRPPPGRSRKAKPSSMVMPRFFSSTRRSQSMPVRALTRVVLPWSMWPAVPMMTGMHASLQKGWTTPLVGPPSGKPFSTGYAGLAQDLPPCPPGQTLLGLSVTCP